MLLETRLKSEFIETLTSFLVFLVEKLQPKKLNLDKNYPNFGYFH